MSRFLIYIGIAVTAVGTVGTGIYLRFFENNNEPQVIVQNVFQEKEQENKKEINKEIEKKEEDNKIEEEKIEEENFFVKVVFISMTILSIIASIIIMVRYGILEVFSFIKKEKGKGALIKGLIFIVIGIGSEISSFFVGKISSIIILCCKIIIIIFFEYGGEVKIKIEKNDTIA